MHQLLRSAIESDRLWFGDILRRHNDDEDTFHFSDPHKVFCIGNVAPESAGEEIFLLEWKCCQLSYAHSRVCALISHFRAVPEVVKSLATKELIYKAKSDNTDLFRNFAETIGAIPLTCDVHGSGKPNFFY